MQVLQENTQMYQKKRFCYYIVTFMQNIISKLKYLTEKKSLEDIIY